MGRKSRPDPIPESQAAWIPLSQGACREIATRLEFALHRTKRHKPEIQELGSGSFPTNSCLEPFQSYEAAARPSMCATDPRCRKPAVHSAEPTAPASCSTFFIFKINSDIDRDFSAKFSAERTALPKKNLFLPIKSPAPAAGLCRMRTAPAGLPGSQRPRTDFYITALIGNAEIDEIRIFGRHPGRTIAFRLSSILSEKRSRPR